MTTAEKPGTASCSNEFDKLQRVIVCRPDYMSIRENMNKIQQQYEEDEFDAQKAGLQHRLFVETMQLNGIDVIGLQPKPEFPEQVFTRDIGFTIGNIVFVAKMAHPARDGEEQVLMNWLNEENIRHYDVTASKIEGGDVLVHGRRVFTGISDRTNRSAAEHLQTLLPDYDIKMIPIDPVYLHLDCVFNIISETDALIFPEAMAKKDVQMLADEFNLIEVNEKEQFSLGTNILSIGDNKILSLPGNKDVNRKMRDRGFEVIEVDISEIIKSGGSFRCCTLPLVRG